MFYYFYFLYYFAKRLLPIRTTSDPQAIASGKLSLIPMGFNRDLVDNVLLRGLPTETKRVMTAGDCKACKKKKKHQ